MIQFCFVLFCFVVFFFFGGGGGRRFAPLVTVYYYNSKRSIFKFVAPKSKSREEKKKRKNFFFNSLPSLTRVYYFLGEDPNIFLGPETEGRQRKKSIIQEGNIFCVDFTTDYYQKFLLCMTTSPACFKSLNDTYKYIAFHLHFKPLEERHCW